MSSLEPLARLLQKHNFKTEGFEKYTSELPSITNAVPDWNCPTSCGNRSEYAFEVVVENERGIKLLGIPLFSGRSLLPLLDPPHYQRVDGVKISLAHDAIVNYPLPDLDWTWSWPQWYVLMLADVDEAGWAYSAFWRPSSCWHGKYFVGDFVRRRLWVRMRQRKVQGA